MSLNRYRVLWSGGPGGDGVSTFYTLDTETSALADLHDFFSAVVDYITDDITLIFPGAGDTIDLATGAVDGSWTETAPSNLNSGALGGGAYVAGVGMRVRWETGGVSNGRRVRGSTFLTSFVSSRFDSDGTINNTAVATVQTAADALAATGKFGIYSRGTPSSGAFFAIQSALAVDRVSWLRTRRQ